MSRQHAADHPIEDHDRGLEFDLQTLSRRSALAFLGTGLLAVAGCSSAAKLTSAASAASAGSSSAATSPASSAAASSAAATSAVASSAVAGSTASTQSYSEIPEETAGPYPGDGSNGPDVLAQSGIVRSDIRSSFGTSTTTAQGFRSPSR